jgi:transcriptional regulator with XRE-family HTH domain
MTELGHRIRRARQTKGLTGAQLAESIGVSANYISELERGIKKNPSMQVIAGMSEVLSVPVDYFFGVQSNRLSRFIPSDLSGYVQETILQPYGATGRLGELEDEVVMEAFVEYLRMRKQDDGK